MIRFLTSEVSEMVEVANTQEGIVVVFWDREKKRLERVRTGLLLSDPKERGV